jgi:hypothetical protein
MSVIIYFAHIHSSPGHPTIGVILRFNYVVMINFFQGEGVDVEGCSSSPDIQM